MSELMPENGRAGSTNPASSRVESPPVASALMGPTGTESCPVPVVSSLPDMSGSSARGSQISEGRFVAGASKRYVYAVRVRELKRAQHVTSEEIAESVGITTSYLSLIERGIREPSLFVACDIAKYLGHSVESLWPVMRATE